MDQIQIRDLEVFCHHGVYPEENRLGQKFLLSLTLYTDTRTAGMTDDLTKSIDYGSVCHMASDFLQQRTYQLIERAAETLAEYLLCRLEPLIQIRVELKKPWAPIGLPVQDVSVEIMRGWHQVYLGVGSNMGEKEQHIRRALEALSSREDCKQVQRSSLITTEPYGEVPQDDFLNGCIGLSTLLYPEELLEMLHQLEQAAGRERTVRWGPRTLDLDILLYDQQIIKTETLAIPHIDMENRGFVLQPLCEIAPDVRHPVSGKTVRQLLAEWEKKNRQRKGKREEPFGSTL